MTIDGVDRIAGESKLGLMYIELDLFSHRTWRDYLAAFSSLLSLKVFRVHVDPEALEYRRSFPAKWRQLLQMGHAEEDLLPSSISVVGVFR